MGTMAHDLRFVPFDPAELDALAAWLCAQPWPFHVGTHLTPEMVQQRHAEGGYVSAEVQSFWIVDANGARVGLLRIEDLLDETPMFDLRVAAAARGRGIGTAALRWLADHVFTTLPAVERIEGQTREDNLAMRRVFRRCGWVKEAHYREAWPGPYGARYASIGYGLLKADWQAGTRTPVPWDDEPLA